jgi:hypothetical protein
LFVKKKLICCVAKENDTLIDFACGKAGDLPKWIAAKLSFVLGIDKFKDNIDNYLDGACARYLKMAEKNNKIPKVLFLNGNSALNLKTGLATENNKKSTEIIKALFGNISKEKAETLGKGVVEQYKIATSGFNISSCQFALHYFFESLTTLKGFLTNVAECTVMNGYFIGTCFDGEKVFQKLQKIKKGESLQFSCGRDNEKKICEIRKDYDATEFEDNENSVGLQISVYQESINNEFIPEYLVNFKYLTRLLDNFGFKPISKEKAKRLGICDNNNCRGYGSFGTLFQQMRKEIDEKKSSKDYKDAMKMNETEKELSNLNNYFIYQKIRSHNVTEAVLQNEQEDQHDLQGDEEGIKEEVFKLQNVNEEIKLTPATEAIDEETEAKKKEEEKQQKQSKKSKRPSFVLEVEKEESTGEEEKTVKTSKKSKREEKEESTGEEDKTVKSSKKSKRPSLVLVDDESGEDDETEKQPLKKKKNSGETSNKTRSKRPNSDEVDDDNNEKHKKKKTRKNT